MKHILFGLASFNKTEIQDNDDFYDNWHSKEYYEDYLVVNENEKYNFSQVYENQKNDVHPPLYYLILRIAMGFHINTFSMWSGIIINIIIYIFITIFMYLIIKMLLGKCNHCEAKSAILALLSSITLASITNAIYIRMYALSTFNIVLTTYLHLRLLNNNQKSYSIFVAISLSALIGSLTHYYYLFYLAMLFIMFVIKFIKDKEYKSLIKYIVAISIAGTISLLIFPYSIKHMFFGYRGQGVISNLLNITQFLSSISQYILRLNVYGFNNLLFFIVLAFTGIIIFKKVKGISIIEEKNVYTKFIIAPSLFYFILVAISSPWIELRYIMPICGLVFTLIIFYLLQLLNNIVKEKTLIVLLIIIFILLNIMPFISTAVVKLVSGTDFKVEPEVLYSNKKEIVNKLKYELNVPTIFLFNSNNNRFLDDILLFANINESYIAKDFDCTEENIKQILKDKKLSNGIVIFINEGQENDKMLAIIRYTTNLHKITYLQRLNACDVYYID